ncbi:MAG: ABC transporter ATP-binding protein [Rickettsiales bacterium]|nr:ABC transporter ATP-binding protein [Rickettsiales bacterium]
MRNSPLLSIRDTTISFAKKILFENLNLNLFPRDRVCLIGKNGAGKTSLMSAIYGSMDFDCGERWIAPKAVIGYLTQNDDIPKNLTVVEYIMGELKLDEHKSYLVDIVCDNLQIDKYSLTHNLSGGQKRRAHLAKALVLEPDILLLDEPTNHLDLVIIEWLEEYLRSYNGALLVISHDRKFLEKVSNKVFWLRAGTIKINHEGYKNFDEWSQSIIDHEQRELLNLEKKVGLESGWLQTGVTGRRKRNIGRLHYLDELRQKLAAQRKLVNANKNHMKIGEKEFDDDAPQVIASLNNVSKSYDFLPTKNRSDIANSDAITQNKKILIEKFSLKILRGEKIGILGKNGSGKSTFLKLLVGEIEPDSGTVKLARDLQFSYFDQQRSAIQPKSSIQEILCGSGSEYVQLPNGKMRHICSYLKDFLFDPQDTKTMAGTLSGGQQNRLLLAKTLANPGNFLILDEPTNDLDMDSLDMLQDYLESYQGTLLVVSHDRNFLDNVVTNILAFEGDGEIISHLGGYSDYLEYKNQYLKEAEILAYKPVIAKPRTNRPSNSKIKFELERIPQKIELLENKILELNNELINSEDRSPSTLAHISIEISNAQQKIDELEVRWEELENILMT